MQMKTKLKQLFTSMGRFGNLLQLRRHLNKTSPTLPAFTLRKLSEISVDGFIRCYCENDLTAMILTGEPSEQDLLLHLTDLVIDYHDLIGSPQSRNMLFMRKRITRLRTKIKMAIYCTGVYLDKRDPQLKEILSGFNFRFEGRKSDDQIIKLLDAHVKNWKIDLSNLEKDVETYIKANRSTEQTTRRTFIENIVDMKKEGYDINIKSTMADEYAVTVCSYNQLMESREKVA